MSVGERVRNLRKLKGMSQAELAGDLFNRSYISMIESGATIPPVETLQLLATKLEVNLDDLLDPPTSPKASREPYHKLLQAKRCKSIPLALESWQKSIEYSLSDVAVDAAMYISQQEGYTDQIHNVLFTTYSLLSRIPIAENQAWFDFMFQLGNSYFNQKSFTEAKQIYESIIQTNPPQQIERRARINLASALIRLTFYELSIMNYERAIELLQSDTENDSNQLLGMCFHGLGGCHHLLGHLDVAYDFTQRAQEKYARIDQDRWHAANQNLGVILVEQKRYNYAKQKLLFSKSYYVQKGLFAKAANVVDDLVKIAILENDLELATTYNTEGLSYLEEHTYDPVLMVRLLLHKCQILKLQQNDSYRDLYTAVKALARAIQFDLRDNALETDHEGLEA